MFGQTSPQEINVNNIKLSLTHISNFISNRKLKNNRKEDIPFLKGFSQIAFDFVSTVFKSGWDQLKTNTNNKSFQELIKDKFTTKVPSPKKEKRLTLFLPPNWLTSPNFPHSSFLLVIEESS